MTIHVKSPPTKLLRNLWLDVKKFFGKPELGESPGVLNCNDLNIGIDLFADHVLDRH